MASASSSSARTLFNDSKQRLAQRVNVNINNFASVSRSIVRGSKSNEILIQAAKNLAQQEPAMDNTLKNLQKMILIQQQLNYQYEAIIEGSSKLESLHEQVTTMER